MPGLRTSDFEEAARLLGEKVLALRQSRGLTQEQLRDRSGLSRNQIQNLEHNRNNIKDGEGHPGSSNARLDTIFALASALSVDVVYLVDPKRSVEPVPDLE